MKKVLSLLLVIVLIFAVAACAETAPETSAEPSETTSATTDESVAEATDTEATDTEASETAEAAASPEEKLSVSAGFLKGPTGIGASYLMKQSELGQTELDYTFTIESDPSIITSAIISGDLDIAAVPTNVASVLYNKTEGAVKIIAINTLSVLYILENGESIQSVADLAGKTIYATGQGANPEYVLNYILRQNGLEPGVDVTIEYGDASELATKMAAGELEVCMLPVPMSTSVLVKNSDVRSAINLGDEWDKIAPDSTLTQGCIVVRDDIDNVDAIVESFLKDYEESVLTMSDSDNIDEAAALAVEYGIIASEAIAKAAIPDSGLIFISGAGSIKDSINGYFEVLLEADPTSIGGAVPDDAFYFEIT